MKDVKVSDVVFECVKEKVGADLTVKSAVRKHGRRIVITSRLRDAIGVSVGVVGVVLITNTTMELQTCEDDGCTSTRPEVVKSETHDLAEQGSLEALETWLAGLNPCPSERRLEAVEAKLLEAWNGYVKLQDAYMALERKYNELVRRADSIVKERRTVAPPPPTPPQPDVLDAVRSIEEARQRCLKNQWRMLLAAWFSVGLVAAAVLIQLLRQ